MFSLEEDSFIEASSDEDDVSKDEDELLSFEAESEEDEDKSSLLEDAFSFEQGKNRETSSERYKS